jgi:hypothetical protein
MSLTVPCPKSSHWRAGLALALIALPCLILTGNTSAAAKTAPSPMSAVHALRPAPTSSGTGLTKIPATPHASQAPARPTSGGDIAVTLTASSTWLWPTQSSALTATSNIDLTQAVDYLGIYDQTTGTYVGSPCDTGTTCAASVTEPTSSLQCYIAVVSSSYPASYPPSGEQATSSTVCVTWEGIGVSLSASPTTLPVGVATTLTATTSTDVGPTPFYTYIYDATTGSLVRSCGAGTSCQATVSQSAATTEDYIAYVALSSTAYPPAGIQATSLPAFVTWSNFGWAVSLSAPDYPVNYSATVTATANRSVGPRPYGIEIFEVYPLQDRLLAVCTDTETCSATVTPGQFSPVSVAAFIIHSFPVLRGRNPGFPPGLTLASSDVATVHKDLAQ